MKIDGNRIVLLSVFVIMEFPKSKTTVKFRDCLGLDHLNLRVVTVTFPMTYCHVYNVTGQVDRKPFI